MIYILNFNKYTFGFYDFAQEFLNDTTHLNKRIALFDNKYILYNANDGSVLKIGYSKSGNWINIFRPTFELSSHDLIWPNISITTLIPLKIHDSTLKRMYDTSGMELTLEEFSNAIFFLIISYNKQVEVYKKLISNISNTVKSKIGDISSITFTQRVVNSEWNCEKNDAWYLSLSLDYIDNVAHTTTNLGDLYINETNNVMLYPRARYIMSKVPNKIKLITEILNGKDTLNHNVSGIEYNITGIIS